MKKNSFFKDLYGVLPLILSGLLFIALFLLLSSRLETDTNFAERLKELTGLFIGIGGVTSLFILVFIVLTILQLKGRQGSAVDTLSVYTEKMHNIRSIIDILYRSKLWLSGLREYIEEEFEGLTFFEVKEFYKGKSKLAIEFLQEKNNFEDTENLYLELKSLLMTNPREKDIPENIGYPNVYDQAIVEKWMEHKVGSGLWYYFGFKFAVYKEVLDYEAVFERHQEKIMKLANEIDREAFEDSSFNEVFLAKLGEYTTKQVIPRLLQLNMQSGKNLPSAIRSWYLLFLVLIVLGLFPVMAFLFFNLPFFVLIGSYSLILSAVLYLATSFYNYLRTELSSKRT
jgi:hypothetical protein